MSKYNNPLFNKHLEPPDFPIKSKTYPLLKFVVHSDSLKDKILLDSQQIKSLLDLEKTPCFEIYFTESKDPQLKTKLEGLGVKVLSTKWGMPITIKEGDRPLEIRLLHAKYIERDLGFADKLNSLLGKLYDPYQEITENSLVTELDITVGQHKEFHCFIVDDNDPFWRTDKARKYQDLRIKDALEFARCFLIDHDIFFCNYHKTGGLMGNKNWYYNELILRSFKQPSESKHLIQILENRGLEEPLLDQYHNSHELYHSFNECLDKIKISLFGDNEAETVYHFNYLILLSASILDNYALLIASFYNQTKLTQLSASQIGIRKSKKDFLKELENINKDLSECINSKKNLIELIFACRDAVIHRRKICHILDQHDKINMAILFEKLQGHESLRFAEWHKDWFIENSKQFNQDNHSYCVTSRTITKYKMASNNNESRSGILEFHNMRNFYVITHPLLFIAKLFNEIRELHNHVFCNLPWVSFQSSNICNQEVEQAIQTLINTSSAQAKTEQSTNNDWQTENIYFANYGEPIR